MQSLLTLRLIILTLFPKAALLSLKKKNVWKTSLCFFLPVKLIYFYATHFKSTFLTNNFKSLDLFTYDILKGYNFINVYQHVMVKSALKLAVFVKINKSNSDSFNFSVESFFFNYWWLERESSELYGLVFNFKSDNRNLLTEFFNTLKPMLKRFPSVGLFEIFYDSFKGYMRHIFNSLQI